MRQVYKKESVRDMQVRYNVYYMNNDGQKVVVARDLLYQQAISFEQKNRRMYGTDLDHETVNPKLRENKRSSNMRRVYKKENAMSGNTWKEFYDFISSKAKSFNNLWIYTSSGMVYAQFRNGSVNLISSDEIKFKSATGGDEYTSTITKAGFKSFQVKEDGKYNEIEVEYKNGNFNLTMKFSADKSIKESKRTYKREARQSTKVSVIYDNCGKSIDCYTIIMRDGSCFGMSQNPLSPNGVNMYLGELDIDVKMGRHLGERVSMSDLPRDVQKAIKNREMGVESDEVERGGNLTDFNDNLTDFDDYDELEFEAKLDLDQLPNN